MRRALSFAFGLLGLLASSCKGFLAPRPVYFAPARSPRWSAFRKNYLRLNRECVACGSESNVTPHHVVPFHLDPSLELDPRNLIPLCENGGNCHFVFGHLKDWRAHNPDVRRDAAAYRAKVKARKYEL